jgi:hypothetical protein
MVGVGDLESSEYEVSTGELGASSARRAVGGHAAHAMCDGADLSSRDHLPTNNHNHPRLETNSTNEPSNLPSQHDRSYLVALSLHLPRHTASS